MTIIDLHVRQINDPSLGSIFFVPPNNFLVWDPWRVFWADLAPFKDPQPRHLCCFRIYDDTRLLSAQVPGCNVPAHCQEQLKQTWIVCCLKPHLFSLIPKFKGAWDTLMASLTDPLIITTPSSTQHKFIFNSLISQHLTCIACLPCQGFLLWQQRTPTEFSIAFDDFQDHSCDR